MGTVRNLLKSWHVAAAALGMNTDNINWQSLAVLLVNHPDIHGQIRDKLFDHRGGWATLGDRTDSEGTSLYLSPKGMAYWVYHGGHDFLYGFVMGYKSQDKMDCASWLHISGGRVDVRSPITKAQRNWLDTHDPSPTSKQTDGGHWREKALHVQFFAAYPDVDKYDVRPVRDFDLGNDETWDRLMLRIEAARNPAQYTTL